jgi:hypothetical protein
MSKLTELASSQITPSPHNTITVELVEPEGMPAVVRIGWPPQPTICDPRRFAEVAAAAMKVLATASTELARANARRRL